MDWKNIYYRIVEKAKNEDREKYNGIYYELHHILPRSLGGSGKRHELGKHPNLVLLTAREHFLCHQLLSKIYGGKMVYALWRLCNDRQNRYCVKNSKEYQRIKEDFSRLNSIEKKKMKGFKHSDISKKHMSEARIGMKFSDEHKKHLSEAHKNREHPCGYQWNEESRILFSVKKKAQFNGKTFYSPKGTKWYTNGTKSIMCLPDKVPPGFKPGRKAKP